MWHQLNEYVSADTYIMGLQPLPPLSNNVVCIQQILTKLGNFWNYHLKSKLKSSLKVRLNGIWLALMRPTARPASASRAMIRAV